MGRMTLMTDAVGVVTKYQYDNIGRVITVTNAFGGGANFEAKTSYTYDNNGNKLTEKDARGNIITYTYDFANRVTVIPIPTAPVRALFMTGGAIAPRRTVTIPPGRPS